MITYPAPTFNPGKPKYILVTAEWLWPIFIIFGSLLLLWLTLFSPVFSVQDIHCQLDSHPCPDSSLLAEINRVKGNNLFRFDAHSFSRRLTSADFTLRQAQIKKVLPRTLVFELSSVYPSVAIRLNQSDEWIILDDRLRVIRSVTFDPNVPTVIVPGPLTLKVGVTPENSELLSVLSLAKSLPRDLPTLSTLTYESPTLTLTFTDRPVVALLSATTDLSPQISSLQAILSGATIDESIKVVDVRFSQPVLK